MSENPLAGDVNIPKLGPVKKEVVVAVAVGAAAFVGWRYWRARQTAAADAATADTSVSDFADTGTVPGVLGAVPADNSFGGDTGATGVSTVPQTQGPGQFSTDADWTQYAADKLSAASDTWSYADVVGALGVYLANGGPTTAQKAIIQAAIGVAGYPPSGQHTMTSGGDTAITVAPGGFLILAESQTTTTVAFNSVPGADHYNVYMNGAVVATGAHSPIIIPGLSSGVKHTFTMAAVTGSGMVGPMSGPFTATTNAVPKPTPAPIKKK